MKYYKPDWVAIQETICEGLSYDAQNNAWLEECKKWLNQLSRELGDDYAIIESENFFILSSEDNKYNQHFLKFLEKALKKILTALEGIASDEGYSKHVVLILADQETYYDYTFMFYPEDAKVGLSAGVYINDGYGHFIFPHQEINFNEPTAAHELTHACLVHLPIPAWLNEGLAVSMEGTVLGEDYFLIDKDIIDKHQQYWTEESIQTFWSGESFSNTDVGQELSYHLAQLLVRNISQDYEQFVHFSKNAHSNDGGETAAQEVLGISLGDLLTGLLGDGNWSPISA